MLDGVEFGHDSEKNSEGDVKLREEGNLRTDSLEAFSVKQHI